MVQEHKIIATHKFIIYYRGSSPDYKDGEFVQARDEKEAKDLFLTKHPRCSIRFVVKVNN